MLNKLITVDKLQDLVKDEMTVMVSGFMGCGTPHKIVDELIKLIECNFEVKKNQEDARNKFFRYNDNNNCERIYNTILEKLNNI